MNKLVVKKMFLMTKREFMLKYCLLSLFIGNVMYVESLSSDYLFFDLQGLLVGTYIFYTFLVMFQLSIFSKLSIDCLN